MKFLKSFLFILFVSSIIFQAQVALAAPTCAPMASCISGWTLDANSADCGGSTSGFVCCCQTGSSGTINQVSGSAGTINQVPAPSACPTGSVCLSNPLNVDSPQALIGSIINAALGIIGSIALIIFIYGGFVWLTSGGNAQKVTQGQHILMWAAIGLVVIFLSYALVKFVLIDLLNAA